MNTGVYEGIKVVSGVPERTKDVLTSEAGLRIAVNDVILTITMRTPGDDLQLVRGLLHAEGVLKSAVSKPHFEISDLTGLTHINVSLSSDQLLDGFVNSRNLISVASCGICGKTELEELVCGTSAFNTETAIESDELLHMFEKMNANQNSFKQTGGSHAAAIYNQDHELVSLFEDIGRHNAVDKAVGNLLLNSKLEESKVLLVSGRISYEIVVKCFKAKIPFLASVSAPSSMAVDFAKELGITLLSFCREDRVTCYSHPKRIKTVL